MTKNMDKKMKNKMIKNLYPNSKVPWLESSEVKVFKGNEETTGDKTTLIKNYISGKKWVWPEKTIYFFSDLHGDREAFLRSLIATGEVKFSEGQFELSKDAKKAKFVLGGDLFDKGPSNLDLLDLIKSLMDAGADIDLLAGNHDIRTFVGIHYMGHKSIKTSHLFTRVGGKSLTLFKEIYDKYKGQLEECPHTEEELKDILFPDETWLKEFPYYAMEIIHPMKLKKETQRISEKIIEIQETTKALGLTLKDIWSCVMKAREIFLHEQGEYYWVFQNLELAKIYGSFVFVHGGLDDKILPELFAKNTDDLKTWFHDQLKEDAFDLYHGPIGNCFRTKYRLYDHPLSKEGIEDLHSRGIYAIVHGHLNQNKGQRLIYRENMLHFQCDCSLDENTRKKEGIPDPGMAVTIFRPEGRCEAISSDYDKIKVFRTDKVSKTKDINHKALDEKSALKNVFEGKVVSKSKKLKFDHESIEDTESIIKYFETIADGFAKGGLKFGNGKKVIKLSPTGLLKLKINVGKNDNKVKLSLDLEWKETKDKKKNSTLLIETDDDSEE